MSDSGNDVDTDMENRDSDGDITEEEAAPYQKLPNSSRGDVEMNNDQESKSGDEDEEMLEEPMPQDEDQDGDKDKGKPRRKAYKTAVKDKKQPKIPKTKLFPAPSRKRKAESAPPMTDAEIIDFWRGKTKAQLSQLLDPKRVPKVVKSVMVLQPIQWESMSAKKTKMEIQNIPKVSKNKWLEDNNVRQTHFRIYSC
jgi:hypothetical protein